MTRIFTLVYLGVLIVLFAAWYIHGEVSRQRAAADLSRVIETAHGGGARLVAAELDAATEGQRRATLETIQKRFDYSVRLYPWDKIPSKTQKRLIRAGDVAHLSIGGRSAIVCKLKTEGETVMLGPFPSSGLRTIEVSLGGWMRLAAAELNEAETKVARADVLEQLRGTFDISVDIVPTKDLPSRVVGRVASGDDVVFFQKAGESGKWLSTTPLATGNEFARFGPFPSFQNIEQRSAATTLALVLLPAALAIALLLRPVAWHLRRVENAARAIAAGDLSARVDVRKVASARTLAEAFNQMASRTESIVRTQRELVQAVSHELRTPLSRMRFAIDLIANADNAEERQRRLESLDAATEELDDLVDELLSYVRLETMEPHLSHEQIDVSETLETLLSKHAAIHPGAQFEVGEPETTNRQTVLADRRGFQRAIGNLLNNAGRHAAGRVQVSACLENGLVVVNVDDDGPGIPLEERDRVFSPFVRLDDESNGRGAGLGLALVRRILIQHGGDAEVRDSPLGGCRIRTTWPPFLATSGVN